MDCFLVFSDIVRVLIVFSTDITDMRLGFVFSFLVNLQLITFLEFLGTFSTQEGSLTSVTFEMTIRGCLSLLLTTFLPTQRQQSLPGLLFLTKVGLAILL